MYIKKLDIHNFKNYEKASLSFSPKVNCFIGDNAAGKTNLLDAIYYLSFCKSYFNAVDTQNIRHDQEYFSILGEMDTDTNKTDLIHCVQKRNQKKSFKLNKKEYQRLADHIGKYPIVMISPYDRDLINEGSDVRRRFIDSIISQFNSLYLDNLINYNKALAQRNSQLRAFSEQNYFDSSLLEIWDHQLIDLGNQIFPERQKFITEYQPLFNKYFEVVTGKKEAATIEYESQLNTHSFEELLASTIERDKALRFTTAGTHKDDLIFNIQGHAIKKFGSQGQQKSFIVALRLAQYMYIKELKGYKPMILLDDIFDKLDNKRVEQLIQLVAENAFGQVFITDTQQDRIEYLLNKISNNYRIFEVCNGTVNEIITL
ncbi:MAG: DNA replication/repair protein RecF [Bacteroidales bacterium]|jgi:DNA replication and repair protein RecF|nr:DNA replication/repair protein RecF [Bacteroidales bacterium]MDI9592397.1 DNA replication/repair protein RecF [Bacteroidota bacterium]OQC37126.1 MAG: DNA replication and repair protein RecF [Bacteroidetes bacterium ADurb.Bin041]MBP7874399.1 DNA replication/repair protein RecF [Bacteroidales bacterium]MCO6468222.1 DNA replication/repair protein RecF [Bacteroidales bacterium]